MVWSQVTGYLFCRMISVFSIDNNRVLSNAIRLSDFSGNHTTSYTNV